MSDHMKNIQDLSLAVSQRLSVLSSMSVRASGRTTAMLHRALVDSEMNPEKLVIVGAYRVSMLDGLKQRAIEEAGIRFSGCVVSMSPSSMGAELRVVSHDGTLGAARLRARVLFMLIVEGGASLKGLPPHRLYIDHHEHEVRLLGLLQEVYDRASCCIELCSPIASLKPGELPPKRPEAVGVIELKPPTEGGRA